MRRLVYSVLLGAFAATVSFSQAGPLRTGFAVVTPITGGVLAFRVTETFTERFDGNFVQSTVQPSPLVTRTSMVVTSDPVSAENIGIAILNPFDPAAAVTLTLLNPRGIIIGARTLIVLGQQQRSRFLTELFSGVPELTEPFIGQLVITSDVPISVLALAFSGPLFTALPATQLGDEIVFNPFGDNGVLLLPQVAVGGGWVSIITITNTSILPQSLRVDFFNSGDAPMGISIASTIPNFILQPGEVVAFSTAR